MYHGFDWYGRMLEVREVSNLAPHCQDDSADALSTRIVLLAYLVQAPSEVEAFVEAFVEVSAVGLEVVSEAEAVSEVDLPGMRRRRVEQVAISRIRIFMRTIPALISRHQRLHLPVQV